MAPGTRAAAAPGFAAAVEEFRSGRDSPRAYLERHLEVIGARDAQLQAFVALDIAGARAAADAAGERYAQGASLSPLDGLPVGLKDVIGTAGLPTRCGSDIFRDTPWNGGEAAVSAALRRAGAVIVGKTASTEFAFGRRTETRNPFDPERTPGTSSSGSAAAVGAGMLPVALGTQLQSSVLRPAAYCGHVGFKPTAGAIRLDGIHPFSPSGDNLGVHAASLGDAWTTAAWLSRTAGTVPGARAVEDDPRLPVARAPLRLMRMYTPGWDLADTPVRDALEQVLARLHMAGVEIVEPASDPVLAAVERDFAAADACITEIAAWEMRWPFLDYADAGHAFHERIGRVLERAREMTPSHYNAALELKAAMRSRHLAAAGLVDGMIGLTAPEVAPRGLDNFGHPVMCAPASCTGAPSISLPLMEAEGLPLGLQLVGFHHADATLAAYARWTAELFASARIGSSGA